MIKVSAVITVYNVEKYLRQCLDSVINQTLKEIEIICVNDGSDDNSLAILNEYAKKDQRIQVIDKPNTGAANSRNIGIEHARGKYLAVLDSDDFYDLEMLEKTYNKAENTGAELVVFRFYSYDDEKGTKKETQWVCPKEKLPECETFSKKDLPDYIFNIIPNNPHAKLYLREFIEKNNIRFEDLKCSNDVTFSLLTIYKAEKIAAIYEPLMYYRTNTATQISAIRGKNAKCIVEAYRAFLRQCSVERIYLTGLMRHIFDNFGYAHHKCDYDERENLLKEYQAFLPQEYWEKFRICLGLN